MKKIILGFDKSICKKCLLILSLVTSVIITACGGSSSSSVATTPPPATTPSTPVATTPPAPANPLYDLTFIESFNLDIAEPSGLSWALNGKDLLVVDDRQNRVYKIDTRGKTLDDNYFYSGKDLEGISTDKQSGTIWVNEESKSKVVQLDSLGNKIQSYKLTIERASKKHSLEGITFDAEDGIFYILNEKDPGLLINWQPDTGMIDQTLLTFANDYSGIYYDNTDSSLWILSDESEKLFHTDTDGVVIQEFDLGFRKAEGLVVDQQNGLVYIIRDSKHKLYVYSLVHRQ